MCLSALLEDGVPDRALSTLVTAELFDATATGMLAAAIVLAVLGSRGARLGSAAASAAAAFGLGVCVHLAILVVGVTLKRRWSARDRAADPSA